MPYVAAPIVLDETTLAELERRARATTSPQRDVKRARVILLAAEGVSSRQISKTVGMHESHVVMWRQRFLADGLDGLRDAPRPGAPCQYGHDEWMKIAALATTAKDPDDPVATWTYQELADALADDIGISRSQLWRILDDLDIKPHKVTGWLNRRDDPESGCRADLVSRLMRYIASYNETAKPFAWTYSGQPLKVAAAWAFPIANAISSPWNAPPRRACPSATRPSRRQTFAATPRLTIARSWRTMNAVE